MIGRTNCEFEKYAKVEILEFIYTVICQTEEDLMKVKNSYRLTMFLDDKTEMVGVVTKGVSAQTCFFVVTFCSDPSSRAIDV